MILYFADRFHALPTSVEEVPFEHLCECYDDILMEAERAEENKANGSTSFVDKRGKTHKRKVVPVT